MNNPIHKRLPKRLITCLVACACHFIVLADVSAKVTLAPLFRDNAVLQRDKPVPVWGRANPGEKITVSFGKQILSTTADGNGRWLVTLAAMPASAEPASMTVSGGNTLTVRNVLVGEVWLCFGAGNMSMPVKDALNPDREIAAAKHPLIRHFKVPLAAASAPAETCEGGWEVCSPKTAGGFSAVAYYFGRELNHNLRVPVGLINSSSGGTAIESWMSRQALAVDPAGPQVAARWQKVLEDYPERLASHTKSLERWTREAEEAKETARNFTKPRPSKPEGPGGSAEPSSLYNAMISPLVPYALRGVICYLGEANANAGRHAEYRTLFPTLIKHWRAVFGQGDIPFYYAQIAAFEIGAPWPLLREAQQSALALPATGEAVTIDIGDRRGVPKNKQEAGRRLALHALARLHNFDVEHSGPRYSGFVAEGGKLRVTFTHAAGLHTKDPAMPGFQIAGEDKVFKPATAVIEGDTVVVHSAKVAKPAAVRYAWASYPPAPLYNAAGLPASPFRSDAFSTPAAATDTNAITAAMFRRFDNIAHITTSLDPEKWHLTLVNANFRLPSDWDPPLEPIKGGRQLGMDARAASHYNKMHDAALADGVTLLPVGAFRSLDLQKTIFVQRTQSHMEQDGMTLEQAIEKAAGIVMVPGGSEHNLGLAVDFSGNQASFEKTDQFEWLMANAADHGFILRYPADKKEVTGINYEPWHWRYTGVEDAKKIKASGLCLEEYLGKRFVGPEETHILKTQGTNVAEFLNSREMPRRAVPAVNTAARPVGDVYITIPVDQQNWRLTHVNANYRVPLDYVPPELGGFNGSKIKGDSRTAAQFNKMYDAAKADGVTLYAFNCYNTIKSRVEFFGKIVKARMDKEGLTEEQATLAVARGLTYPGASEHNLGISVGIASRPETTNEGVRFAGTAQFRWLVANAADYGFILRYPAGKTAITGLVHQPWIWRYVGVEDAKKIKAQGVCLEEYLGRRHLSLKEAREMEARGINMEEYLKNQGKSREAVASENTAGALAAAQSSARKYVGFEYITISVDPQKWYLTCANTNYRLPLDFAPPSVENVRNSRQRMDSRAAPHFNKMYDAAKADGVTLIPYSGYRSIEMQESIFNQGVQRFMEQNGMTEEQAIVRQSQNGAFPGGSDHNLGLAMDFRPAEGPPIGLHFEQTDQFEWLMANAADYGFILRYAAGKKAITGFNYEPWHWRYVGVEDAKQMKTQGVCLEEYVGMRFISVDAAKKMKRQGINVEEYLKKQANPKSSGVIESPARNPKSDAYIIITIDPQNWHLTHLNRNYRVALDYVPPSLTALKDSKVEMDSRAAPQYNKMYDAAKADGITLKPISGYRTMEWQEMNFNRRVRGFMAKEEMSELEAVMKTATGSMYPGGSEHNIGITVDLHPVSYSFADTEQSEWLMANAADYGFVLRYPADKTKITGVIYEPWHWRYVGVEDAKKMKARGVCLEEYLGRRHISVEEVKKLKAKGINIEEFLLKQGKQ